jgi:hypothetical protein
LSQDDVKFCFHLSWFRLLWNPVGMLQIGFHMLQTPLLTDTWQLDECNNTKICSASSVALIMASWNSKSMANSLTSAYNQVDHLIGEIWSIFVLWSSICSINFHLFLPCIDLTFWVNSEVRCMHHQTFKSLSEGKGISWCQFAKCLLFLSQLSFDG